MASLLATLSALCPSPAASTKPTPRSSTMIMRRNRPYKVEEDDSDDDDEDNRKTCSTNTTNTTTTMTCCFSQEEEEIRHLESTGAMNHVVGATSMLSQEILRLTQDNNEQHQPKEMDPTKMGLVTRAETQFDDALESTTSKRLLPLESSSQVSSTSQLSAMSVLMDAAELMSKSQEQLLPDSFQEVPSMEQQSLLTTNNKKKMFSLSQTSQGSMQSQTSMRSQTSLLTTTTTPKELPPKRMRAPRKLPTTTASINSSIAKPSIILVKATPTTMIIKLPFVSNNSNKAKRKDPPSMALVATSKNKSIKTSFKSASRSKLTPTKKRKIQKEKDRKSAYEMAQLAAQLAAQTIASPEVAKNLLLSMALVRINPRSAPANWPVRGAVIYDGFFWGTYPPLETILRRHMREYYELSTTKCQSKSQQKFNNRLTVEIRAESKQYGWVFCENFDDKVLRDRIRCFFKTHIQK